MERPVITGWGMARGSRTVTNKELACIIAAYGGRDNLTTGDIIQHTGMVTRYWVDPQKGETTLTLALAASRQALEQAGISPEALDAIIMATVSPDYGNGIPASACLLQRELIGSSVLFQIPAFDMNAACSGFVYGCDLPKR